jgi:hypothetical protein
LDYDFDVFVPGHLTRLGTRVHVEVQKKFFQDHLDEIPRRHLTGPQRHGRSDDLHEVVERLRIDA